MNLDIIGNKYSICEPCALFSRNVLINNTTYLVLSLEVDFYSICEPCVLFSKNVIINHTTLLCPDW